MRNSRAYLIILLLVFCFMGLIWRLYALQLGGHERFLSLAYRQHRGAYELHPRRGAIYDRFMEVLAVDLEVKSLFADPTLVGDPKQAAKDLSGVLDINEEELARKLSSKSSFVWLKRKIPKETAERIEALNVQGVYLLEENKRNYPNDSFASHVLGFAGIDNQGLSGLELFYDEYLKGEPGWRYLIRDAARRTIWVDEERSVLPRDGFHLVLTLDSVIQFITENELAAMVEKFNPDSASIVVTDPDTGKILAMANYPDFDPNSYGRYPDRVWRNLAVGDVYEPGSVFKVITAAAVLQEGAVLPEDVIYCENGSYNVAGRVLRDYHGHGELTFKQVIARSSNIGTVKAAMEIGKDKLYEYIRAFGFAEKTNVDLPGEEAGILRSPERWSRSDITTIPMGQGIAVTSIQLAAAMGAVANGGVLMQPYITEKMITPDGQVYREFSPKVRRRVISSDTSQTLKEILHEVIKSGTGRHARSKKYDMCGKTGTAQVASPGGGYYEDRYTASFMGFAPKEEPKLTIVVTASNPRPVYFGGSVAAPTFKRIAEEALEYLISAQRAYR